MIVDQESTETRTPTYDELLQEHRRYERRLEELLNKSWLTPEEELEEKEIKKMKLRLKDQMARLSRPVS
ncbi:MAG: DUF465 domain-containing protein [Acidobacteria bacterium]|nr:DUF465 domain-containing protein [Acidobacteriota bacterium]